MNKILSKIVCGFFVFCQVAFLNSLQAEHRQGGRGFFQMGWTSWNFKNLNQTLEANGYGAFPSSVPFSLGGMGLGQINRFLIGGEGQGFILGGGINNSVLQVNGNLVAGVGSFLLGYIVHQDEHFSVYPLLGIGGGGAGLQLTRYPSPGTFDDVLKQPYRNTHLLNGSFVIDLSIVTDFVPYWSSADEDTDVDGGFAMGLRLGARYCPGLSQWSLERNSLSGGPQFNLTGVYAQFMIGGEGMKVPSAREFLRETKSEFEDDEEEQRIEKVNPLKLNKSEASEKPMLKDEVSAEKPKTEAPVKKLSK